MDTDAITFNQPTGHRIGVRCYGTRSSSYTRSSALTRQRPPTRLKRLPKTARWRGVLCTNLPL